MNTETMPRSFEEVIRRIESQTTCYIGVAEDTLDGALLMTVWGGNPEAVAEICAEIDAVTIGDTELPFHYEISASGPDFLGEIPVWVPDEIHDISGDGDTLGPISIEDGLATLRDQMSERQPEDNSSYVVITSPNNTEPV